MTAIELCKLIFNESLPDDVADAIIWSCTGFPTFWHTNNPVREMTYQLRHAKRAMKRGFTMDQVGMGDDREATEAAP